MDAVTAFDRIKGVIRTGHPRVLRNEAELWMEDGHDRLIDKRVDAGESDDYFASVEAVTPEPEPVAVAEETEEHVHEYATCDCGMHKKDAPTPAEVSADPTPVAVTEDDEGARYCEQCDDDMPAGARADARYCSQRCRQAAYRGRQR